MAVGRDYLLKKPSGPSGPKLFLDTQVVPLAANIAGSLEVALDRAAARTGVRPALILAGATGLIGLGLIRLLTRRDRVEDRFERM
ncbi:hypothetical protein MRF4_24570 [Methylobacterium radiotolerans]|uniref:hypothetical protein n=1 Tax=Methylobacterium TaxID=407 RepID=UPI002F2E2F71